MEGNKVSRRSFLKAMGTIGAVAAVGPAFIGPAKQIVNGVWEDEPHGVGTDTQDYGAENVIFTSCQQCNAACTIKAYVVAGSSTGAYSSIVRKIAGNTYSPLGMVGIGHIDYDTPVKEAVKGTGDVAVSGRGLRGARTCLKGQAGIQTAYDAYRVQHPLKRVGERGSGVWKTITWEDAYKEILEGSQDLGTPGLKEIWAYVPETPVMEDWDKVKSGEMSQADFDKKYKDVLIDTKHPDFGPKANQIAFMSGARRDFIQRVVKNSLGTNNYYDHGGYCGVTGVIGNNHSNGKQKKRVIPDYEKAEFVIIWGTNPLVANRGPTTHAPQITRAIERGMKMVVVDPRLSKTAEKAHQWVPVKPGGDGALAIGMCRWIIENKRYDEKYLRNPNQEAAALDNEPTWSDATYLVNIDDPKRPYLRAKDIGIGEDENVVLVGGVPTVHTEVVDADLEVDTTINGIRVKSAFTLFKEKTMEKSMEEYAEMSGVDVATIVQLADEWTSHGKRVGIHAYRGATMHGNGYYAARCIQMLNHLIGNHDWIGGDTGFGAKFKTTEGVYDLTTVPNANKSWGIQVTRQQIAYEKTSLFDKDGYPAKRPWYPFGNNLIHEVLPSSAEGYPYKIRALFINRTSPIMAGPRSHMQERFIKDPKVVELVVSSDIVIGDTSQYADYILPDLSYLESWNAESIFPIIKYKFAGVIQPVTRVVPDARQTEQVYIDLFKAMGLPGVGDNAFPDGSPLHRPEDYYLKMVANIAFDGEPVKDANDEELAIFEKARQLALGKYFDINVLKNAVKPEEWRKVIYVLNRGGRFEGIGNEHDPNGLHQKYKFAAQSIFYNEKMAAVRNSYTGEFYSGVAFPEVIRKYNGEVFTSNKPFQFINWKSRNMATNRSESNTWLREVRDENYLWMNPTDAKKYGIENGDYVSVTSTSSTETARVLVFGGIRPGVVGANFSFGSTGYNANKVTIDGKEIEAVQTYSHLDYQFNEPMHEESGYARKRGMGFNVNALTEVDDSFFEGYLADRQVGGPAQLDVFVDIKKITV